MASTSTNRQSLVRKLIRNLKLIERSNRSNPLIPELFFRRKPFAG